MSTPRIPYQALTLAEKAAAILEVEKGLRKKSEIAKDLGIPSTTLSTYLKNKDKILESASQLGNERKRARGPHNSNLMKAGESGEKALAVPGIRKRRSVGDPNKPSRKRTCKVDPSAVTVDVVEDIGITADDVEVEVEVEEDEELGDERLIKGLRLRWSGDRENGHDFTPSEMEESEDEDEGSLRVFFDSMFRATRNLSTGLQRTVKRILFNAVTEAEEEQEAKIKMCKPSVVIAMNGSFAVEEDENVAC